MCSPTFRRGPQVSDFCKLVEKDGDAKSARVNRYTIVGTGDGRAISFRAMRNLLAAAAALCLAVLARHASAQDSSVAAGYTLSIATVAPTTASLAVASSTHNLSPAPRDSGAVHLAKYRQYPWNGMSIWAGHAYETRSAAHNEHFAGAMTIVGVQLSRDVWRGQKTRVAYLGELLPLMLSRSGPPANRIPDTLRNHYSQAEISRFKYRDAVGFGFAPLGAEVTYHTSQRTSALFNITAGGLLFNKVVPYGKGTQPNFTVSPGIALQWEPVNRTRVAIGYTFHHLSNASFGQANPGMNSQMLLIRVSRLRNKS